MWFLREFGDMPELSGKGEMGVRVCPSFEVLCKKSRPMNYTH
jgi:hypothetical protein